MVLAEGATVDEVGAGAVDTEGATAAGSSSIKEYGGGAG